MNYSTFKQELIGTFDSLEKAQAYVASHPDKFNGYSAYYNIIG